MTTRQQIEKDKALIIQNLGIYTKKNELMKRLNLPRDTFYRRLKEIQEDKGLLPDDYCSTTTIERFNQMSARADNYWNHYRDAEEEYETLKTERPEHQEDSIEYAELLLAHQTALEYTKALVIDWGYQYECAFKAIIYLLKSIGIYKTDALLNISAGKSIEVNMFNMGPKEPKLEKEVNIRPKTKGKK